MLSRSGIHLSTAAAEPARQMASPVVEVRQPPETDFADRFGGQLAAGLDEHLPDIVQQRLDPWRSDPALDARRSRTPRATPYGATSRA